MFKKIFFIAALFVSCALSAQVTINIQLPPAGMVQKDQLWNIVVVNNNAGVTDATISLDIQDAITGQPVLSAASRSFALGKGVKMINIRDLQPLQYNYLATELTGTYLPLGNYVACYRVYKNDLQKGPLPLGDDCVRINILPLSPPLLNLPADNAVLENAYPQFNWLPPAPTNMFNNLNYDLLVSEILPGQTATEAILYNAPVYTAKNLTRAFENYPSSFSSLKAGGRYAWQVTARNGLNYAAQTETWSFLVKPADTIKTELHADAYIMLHAAGEGTGITYIKGEELLVKYYSFDKDRQTTIILTSADGKKIKEVKQKISYGNNFFSLKLGAGFKKGEVYLIKLENALNSTYSAQFIIQ